MESNGRSGSQEQIREVALSTVETTRVKTTGDKTTGVETIGIAKGDGDSIFIFKKYPDMEKWKGVGLTLIRHAARLQGNASTL